MLKKGDRTKAQIVEAALATLKAEGFAGTSARAIAQRGGFNQALIFYHFGDLNRLLLAALDASAAERLARYKDAVDAAGSPAELASRIGALFREDAASGHMTVIAELIGASLTHPELAPELRARMKPWLDLVRQALERFDSPLAQLVPPRDAATAIVAFGLGVNLLGRLDPGRLQRLLRTLDRVAPLLVP